MAAKATIGLKILELLGETAMGIGDFLGCFLTDRATSYRRLRGLPDFPRKKKWAQKDAEAEMCQQLYDVLYRLKRDQLIEKSNNGKWRITLKGRERKKEMNARKNFLPSTRSYASEESPEWKIVIFDIPEKQRLKREWLRAVLRRLGFRMLQRSVWIGKVKLPQNFIEDLGKLNLLRCVEILAITKHGSLRQLQ